MAAWFPLESGTHMAFFIVTMKQIVFNVVNVPFVSDMGHLLATVRLLYRLSGIVICVKFYSEHIIRNVVDKFKIGKKGVTTLCSIMSKI